MMPACPAFCLLGAVLVFSTTPAYAQNPVTMEEAAAYYEAEAWQQAAEAYAALAEHDASNQTAWFRWAASLRQLERFEAAAAVYERMAASGSAPPFVLHMAASMHAAAGHPDKALTWLEKAVQAGYGNVQQLEADTLLATLRDNARFTEIMAQADRNARPCFFSDVHRQFDFWVGEWDVITAQGQQAGTNSIQPTEQHCVLVERWTGSGGSTGMSINYYDPGKEKWVQQWVAAGGYVVSIEGGLDATGSMVLTGTITTAQGQTNPFRGTWTLLEDGRVRQFFEQSNDGGTTWTPWFEGFYVRKE